MKSRSKVASAVDSLRPVPRRHSSTHALRRRDRLGRDRRAAARTRRPVALHRESFDGRFAPLEATAAVTGLDVIRAIADARPADPRGDDSFFNGHVPVTAMVILLGAVAAVASGRGGVALATSIRRRCPICVGTTRTSTISGASRGHAEQLMADAIAERVGDELVVASFLRDRSELWVAQDFALKEYHHVFRSCNRAFAQRPEDRATTWCGECDKCVFINLILAPFISRAGAREIFSSEPLSDPRRDAQLARSWALGVEHKPFECVGDPDECAVALSRGESPRRVVRRDAPRRIGHGSSTATDRRRPPHTTRTESCSDPLASLTSPATRRASSATASKDARPSAVSGRRELGRAVDDARTSARRARDAEGGLDALRRCDVVLKSPGIPRRRADVLDLDAWRGRHVGAQSVAPRRRSLPRRRDHRAPRESRRRPRS